MTLDGRFEHVEKPRYVVFVDMLLVPQAGAAHPLASGMQAKPQRRLRIDDRLVCAAGQRNRVAFQQLRESGPGLVLNLQPQERQAAKIVGNGGFDGRLGGG